MAKTRSDVIDWRSGRIQPKQVIAYVGRSSMWLHRALAKSEQLWKDYDQLLADDPNQGRKFKKQNSAAMLPRPFKTEGGAVRGERYWRAASQGRLLKIWADRHRFTSFDRTARAKVRKLGKRSKVMREAAPNIPEYLRALTHLRRLYRSLSIEPLRRWHPSSVEALREDLEPLIAELWPDGFKPRQMK